MDDWHVLMLLSLLSCSRLIQSFNVKLLHLQHGLHDPLGFLAIAVLNRTLVVIMSSSLNRTEGWWIDSLRDLFVENLSLSYRKIFGNNILGPYPTWPLLRSYVAPRRFVCCLTTC